MVLDIAHGAWEDSLVYVAHVAAHCVGACCCTLVVLSWASACSAGVVVVHVAAMCKTVVPVLVPFYRHGEEAAWGLISSVATTVSNTIVAATTAAVATAVCIATPAVAAVAATTNVVAATTANDVTVATTLATAIVATALQTMAAAIPRALWLLLWGLAGANYLEEHLKLALNHQNVGGVRL